MQFPQKEVKHIEHAFRGKLVGTARMKRAVCETLLLMPKEVVNFITENCWFLASLDDAWAFTFTGNDLKDQHLIFLSDELLSQHAQQVRYSITHEIGHVMLKHRNSVLEKQSKEEIKKQEKEADAFARQFVLL